MNATTRLGLTVGVGKSVQIGDTKVEVSTIEGDRVLLTVTEPHKLYSQPVSKDSQIKVGPAKISFKIVTQTDVQILIEAPRSVPIVRSDAKSQQRRTH